MQQHAKVRTSSPCIFLWFPLVPIRSLFHWRNACCRTVWMWANENGEGLGNLMGELESLQDPV
jgi:hypothetical protein